MKNRVRFGKDYIAICDEQGEIVRWVKDEWIEDPDVVFPIINTVKFAAKGKDVRTLLDKTRSKLL